MAPFSQEQGIDWRLITLFLLINSLVFYNVLLHDPRIGYDGGYHLSYLDVLSTGKLPDQTDTKEFFVPPLPYTIAALAKAKFGISIFKAARLSQAVNGLLSSALLFLLLKTCLLISPQSSLRIGTLAAIGILPIYYRSFTLIRGEPYLAFFAVLILYQVLIMLLSKKWRLTQMIFLGITMGLGALSRQWGFFLFPVVGILFAWEWFRRPLDRLAITRGILAMFLTAGLISGTFYSSLYLRYGSLTAFNRSQVTDVSFSKQLQLFPSGANTQLLFTQPVRPNFPNQVLPILYSDTWGDYWGYFSIFGRDNRTSSYISGKLLIEKMEVGSKGGWLESNYESFSGYLGCVNLFSLFPTLLVGCSIVYACFRLLNRSEMKTLDKEALAFSLLAVIATLAGYGWFLINYPNIQGDTIKAIYILQIYPYLALMTGIWLSQVKDKSRLIFMFLMIGLGLVVFHNLPAMVTHYILY